MTIPLTSQSVDKVQSILTLLLKLFELGHNLVEGPAPVHAAQHSFRLLRQLPYQHPGFLSSFRQVLFVGAVVECGHQTGLGGHDALDHGLQLVQLLRQHLLSGCKR